MKFGSYIRNCYYTAMIITIPHIASFLIFFHANNICMCIIQINVKGRKCVKYDG